MLRFEFIAYKNTIPVISTRNHSDILKCYDAKTDS